MLIHNWVLETKFYNTTIITMLLRIYFVICLLIYLSFALTKQLVHILFSTQEINAFKKLVLKFKKKLIISNYNSVIFVFYVLLCTCVLKIYF